MVMKGKRYSHQRELIYGAVRESGAHPTAEMIYQRLKPANPNLSLGTVYRNLNTLTQEGRLVRMSFQVDRYDARTGPHAHFLCRTCGGVFDVELPYDDAMDRAASGADGQFQVERHDLIFYGLCAACRLAGERRP